MYDLSCMVNIGRIPKLLEWTVHYLWLGRVYLFFQPKFSVRTIYLYSALGKCELK